ncbi:MAG: hypothetical protein ACR2K9_07285 [Solirubrobacteraceae bacterium]
MNEPLPGPETGAYVATLRALLEGAGALRAVALVDRGEAAPLVVDVSADGVVELVDGERTIALAEDAYSDDAPIPGLPPLREHPPMEIDADEGTVSGPLGALDHMARGIRDAAALFPGRTVLTVGFETSDPGTPMFLAAREGEPMVVALGERQFELEVSG